MTDQPYAELPSEIPPVGNRRIRTKPVKVFAWSTLMVVLLYCGVGFCVILVRSVDHLIHNPLAAVFCLVLVGVCLILPAWFGRLLMREHRILRIGKPVEGQIAAVELPWGGDGHWSYGSITYRYRDPSGQVREGRTDYGGGPGDVFTILVDPDNPKRHVILRRSYYRILKDPAGGPQW